MELTFYPMKKIEIIVEHLLLKNIIKLIEDTGASGYTIHQHIDGKGKGKFYLHEADVLGDSSMRNVMIICIAPEAIAFKILEGFKDFTDLFDNSSCIVYMSDVSVISDWRFEKTKS